MDGRAVAIQTIAVEERKVMHKASLLRRSLAPLGLTTREGRNEQR